MDGAVSGGRPAAAGSRSDIAGRAEDDIETRCISVRECYATDTPRDREQGRDRGAEDAIDAIASEEGGWEDGWDRRGRGAGQMDGIDSIQEGIMDAIVSDARRRMASAAPRPRDDRSRHRTRTTLDRAILGPSSASTPRASTGMLWEGTGGGGDRRSRYRPIGVEDRRCLSIARCRRRAGARADIEPMVRVRRRLREPTESPTLMPMSPPEERCVRTVRLPREQ
jgi:hypothetical protein